MATPDIRHYRHSTDFVSLCEASDEHQGDSNWCTGKNVDERRTIILQVRISSAQNNLSLRLPTYFFLLQCNLCGQPNFGCHDRGGTCMYSSSPTSVSEFILTLTPLVIRQG